jgi:hypothetical protein
LAKELKSADLPDFPLIKNMATIVVFASSLLMASGLVAIKAIELRNDRKNILLKLINKLDSRFGKIVAFLKFKFLQVIQSIRYIILIEAPKFFKNLFEKVQQKIIDEYKKRQDTIITGKKNIVNKGSVSFYLKKITEHKESEGKGKINGSL